jgi:hypothetical protein
MGGRDHSYQCDDCGQYRGGLNDITCDCDERPDMVHAMLYRLASNLATAAGLQLAFQLGDDSVPDWSGPVGDEWRPGCSRAAPGWEGK